MPGIDKHMKNPYLPSWEELHLDRQAPGRPRITQDGRDGDRDNTCAAGIVDGVTLGCRRPPWPPAASAARPCRRREES